MKKFVLGAKQTAFLLLALFFSVVTAVGLGGKNPAESNLWLTAIALALILAAIVLAVRVSPPEGRAARSREFGCLSLVFFGLTIIVYPVMQSARAASERTTCVANLKQMALVFFTYAADFDDHFPPSAKWRTVSKPYGVEDQFRCRESKARWTYAMNAAMSGISVAELEVSEAVLLFEAEAFLPDASGGPEWLALRHQGGGVVARADGSTRWTSDMVVKDLIWDPRAGAKH